MWATLRMLKSFLQTAVTILVVIAVAKIAKPYLPKVVADYLPS